MVAAAAAEYDEAITEAIEREISGADYLNPFDVGVSAERGVVTLKGKAYSTRSRKRLESFARKVPRVRQVIDLIEVNR